jgi:hypothetical protein
MKRVTLIVCFIAVAWLGVAAHIATPDEEAYATDAIQRHLNATRPWGTCEYVLNLLRRDGSVLVYRVTFSAKEKCSRSRSTEYFEASYDVAKHKLLKMIPVAEPDPPPIDAE